MIDFIYILDLGPAIVWDVMGWYYLFTSEITWDSEKLNNLAKVTKLEREAGFFWFQRPFKSHYNLFFVVIFTVTLCCKVTLLIFGESWGQIHWIDNLQIFSDIVLWWRSTKNIKCKFKGEGSKNTIFLAYSVFSAPTSRYLHRVGTQWTCVEEWMSWRTLVLPVSLVWPHI